MKSQPNPNVKPWPYRHVRACVPPGASKLLAIPLSPKDDQVNRLTVERHLADRIQWMAEQVGLKRAAKQVDEVLLSRAGDWVELDKLNDLGYQVVMNPFVAELLSAAGLQRMTFKAPVNDSEAVELIRETSLWDWMTELAQA